MGGHSVVQNPTNPKDCVHHFDPNHREHFMVGLEHRTVLQTLCISTRFFAGNPGSDLMVTLIDDVSGEQRIVPIPHLQPDAEHWFADIDFPVTRIQCQAGGITRIWAYGTKQKRNEKVTWLSKNRTVVFKEDDFSVVRFCPQ